MSLCRITLTLLAVSCLHAATLELNQSKNQFSFAALRNASMTLNINGTTHFAKWSPSSRTFTLAADGAEWTATLTARDTNYLAISSTIRNTSQKPIKLGRATLADAQLNLGDQTSALLMSGWGVWVGVKPITSQKQVSKTLTQLYNPKLNAALQLGFETFDRINTEQELWFDESSKQFRAAAYCDFEGWQLKPGQSVATETLLIGAIQDPITSLEKWADHVQAHYKPKVWKSIPSGWVGWTWVDPFKIEQYEAVVRRNARAIRETLPGLGLDYIWISLGNLKDREAGNWLNWNEKLLPSGPRKLVADLKDMDFKLGLWSGAFWLSSRLTKEVEELRDAFLLKDGKPMTVPHRELGDQYILDPTHPKTKTFLTNVFQTYREWGIRYFMIDFLYSISGSTPGRFRPDSFYNKDLIPGPETYRAGLKIIRDAAGPETYLLSSTGPTFHNLGYMDGMRVGNDYGEGRPLDGPGKGFYPGTFVINSPTYWTSHQAATGALAMSWFMHNKLFIADSGNVLSVDQPIPLPDAQISATLFGINGSPLMLGDDIARMSSTRIELLRQQFPRLPEAATPLDLFTATDYPKLFHLKVHKPWDNWSLVAIFNYSKKDFGQIIDLASLGFDKKVMVWDHWQERYLGIHHGTITLSVPTNGVRYIRIAEERPYPWLLSTNLHIRQGQADIDSVNWNPATSEIEVEAARPAGYRGSIYLHVPKGLAATNPEGLFLAKDANDGSLIVRVPVECNGQGKFKTKLQFKPYWLVRTIRAKVVMKNLSVPLTILLLASSTLSAQSNGSISGTVTGANSAGIAGATVTATNITSSTWFSAVTNAAGAFDLSYIPIGSYIVSAQSKGLKKTFPAIQLESNQTVRLNLRLESGGGQVPVETRTVIPMPTPTPKIDETKLTLQELIKLTNKVFQQNKEPELSLNLRKLLSDPKSIANSYPTVGDFYYKNGDYEKAAQIYDVGIKSDLLNLVPLQKRMIEVKVAQKQLPDAQELAETLIKKYPNDSDAIAIRATLKLFVGKPEEQAGAIADLQSTVSKMPDNFVLRFNLGRGLLQQGNTQAAQAQFQESIKLRPEYIPPRLALAQIQLQARDWSKALTSGNEILAINSSNISARLIRTSALMGMAAFTQARQELEETLSLYPSSNDARYQLGFIDFQEKKFADAEKQFRQLYETNPADSRGLMGLCEIFMARGDFDSALNILKKEIVRHPGQLNLLLALGNMATRANKFDEAIAVYAQLLEKNPADAAMHAKLGSAYRSKGEVNKATEHFKKAIELAPTDPAAYTELAIVLETNGNHAQAKPLYEKVLAIQPDSLVALNNLAFMLAEDGSDLDRALTLAQRARQVSGSDPNVADTLGWIYIKKNLPDNAIGLFTELIRKYPNHPSLAAFQMHLGMAYAQRGDKASARKAFEAALLAKPSEKDKQEIQALLEKMN